jgi:hypothetical protein
MDGGVYAEITARNLALRYSVINVALLGLIYGAAALHFSRPVLERSGAFEGHYNPLLVVMVGVSLAFLMHGGAALFIWVFCRALGGCAIFMGPYLNLGAAAIAVWPMAPLVALLQVEPAGFTAWAATLASAAYAIAVGYTAVQAAAGLSRLKMFLCAAATLFYVACFLYLWT